MKLSSFLRLLLPRACPGCRTDLGTSLGLCSACSAKLQAEVISDSVLTTQQKEYLISLGRYEGSLKRTILAFKYQGSRDLALVLAKALAPYVPPHWAIHTVCPVPLHPARERERGYNQAHLLAKALADELKLECKPLLKRIRYTGQQAQMKWHKRASNVKGAFIPRQPVAGNILLVDDVLTTGQTLLSCSKALHTAGASQIYFLVLAH